LTIISPKNKIPFFPAKAGEKPNVFQLNSDKQAHFPALPALPARMDTLQIK